MKPWPMTRYGVTIMSGVVCLSDRASSGLIQGQTRGRVGRDVDGRSVEVGEALHEVVGVPLEDHLDALVVRLEHERSGADYRIRVVEVLELVLRLAGEDRAEARARQVIEEGRVRFF